MRAATATIVLFCSSLAMGNVFDMPPGLTSLETVPVGNPGNAGDTRYPAREFSSFGSVSYPYNIGKYEVTAGQYCEFLNAVAKTDTYGLYNTYMWEPHPAGDYGCKIQQVGTSGDYTYTVASDYANRPVNYVNYWDACRFANWLHNGQPTGVQGMGTTETGAYTLTPEGMVDGTVSRNATWKWAVTNGDEWYKAAYYKGGSTNAGYWDYPTASDTVPSLEHPPGGSNSANYYGAGTIGPTDVGAYTSSESPYGTFDQGGNVWEWNETVFETPYRSLRGGCFTRAFDTLHASYRTTCAPLHEDAGIGFRVVQVPEPESVVLLVGCGAAVLARRRRLRLAVEAGGVLLWIMIVLWAPVSLSAASFRGIGQLPNGELAMEARNVSSNGDFVVGQTSGGNSFRWSISDGLVLLGDSVHTSINTYAEGVSADGSVVVGSVMSAGKQDAFRWTPQQGMELLESLSDGGGSTAAGLSADGRVVVGTSYSSSGSDQAFRYTPENGRQAIGNMPGWESGGAGLAVSADGSTGVGFSANGDDRQAFRWTETTGTIGLGWLPTSVLQSTALGVSPDGGVVVGYCHHGPNEEEAFKWTIGGGMVGLGTPGGEQESYAYGVSQDGSTIVGEARGLTPQSVIWDNTHGARYLKQVLTDEYGLDLAGWGLERAYAISADGRVIVGRGTNPAGQSEAWIAYIPEPASLLLLALAGLAVIRRGHRVRATIVPAVLVVCLLSAVSARADVFDMPAGLTSLETVPVGNPGNAGELSGEGAGGYGPDRICGAVSYIYNIGKYEVTAGQYTEFLNAVGGVDIYGLYDTSMWSDRYGCKIELVDGNGTSGSPYEYRVASNWANRPVNYVSWGSSARFANWLHNGQPTGAQGAGTTETGAYTLNGATTDAQLLAVDRNSNWKWAITSEDEWYKAAYHKNDGVTANYWDYPTGTNATPSSLVVNPDPGNNANFCELGCILVGPYYRTEVGEFENSDSPCGTFDQGGNVWEWNEAVLYDSYRGVRGGAFSSGDYLHASNRHTYCGSPSSGHHSLGFRVVQVPEPGTLLLLALAGLAVMRRQR
ncbi:MAG: SUMF1/EgtB/PvdO family nonheme iron enzyme [Phycisphaerae bacterium]|nr:SUMF1/EgtB/PvdO family nonheme iron enzyme [Phycisphaerae bacterium]